MSAKKGKGLIKVVGLVAVALIAFMVLVPARAEKEIPLLPPPSGFDPGDIVTTIPSPFTQTEETVTSSTTTMTTTVSTITNIVNTHSSAVAALIGPDGSVVISSKLFSITRTPVKDLRVEVTFNVPETDKKYIVITVSVAFAPALWRLDGTEPNNVWRDGMVLIDGSPAKYCVSAYCPGSTYSVGVPSKWFYKNALYGVNARYWTTAEPGTVIKKVFEFRIADALKELEPYAIGYVAMYVGVNIKAINSEFDMRFSSSTIVGGETSFTLDVVDGNVVFVG